MQTKSEKSLDTDQTQSKYEGEDEADTISLDSAKLKKSLSLSLTKDCSKWALVLFAQFVFSFFLMSFAAYRIAAQASGTSPEALWVSILTSTATLWLPAPHSFQSPAVSAASN